MRISRPQLFMEIAQVVAKRATCMRLNVGAVLVKDRSIVAIGYNGQAPGHPHCTGNDCPGKFHCRETTHAEINAIRHLPEGTEGPLDLYVTDSPCEMCWDHLVEDERVKRVFFGTPYRINEHLTPKVLYPGRPEVYRVLPAGYVMDWRSKELVEIET